MNGDVSGACGRGCGRAGHVERVLLVPQREGHIGQVLDHRRTWGSLCQIPRTEEYLLHRRCSPYHRAQEML